MSAQEQMRAMLDQLMGTARDGPGSSKQVRFDDPRVCKSFLLACCPHEILASTRMDLGECPKIHELALRADYEQAAKERDYGYVVDALQHLETFIAECDRKTELAKRRLKETQEELSEEAAAKAEVIHRLGEQIGTKLAHAENVGAEGNVEESLKLMEEVDRLKKDKSTVEIEYRNSMPASSYQQQKLRVCEVCSAYLGIHDNDRRLADHFGGKLHLGFIIIREKLQELIKLVEERKAQREREVEERDKERHVREKERMEQERGAEEERRRERDRRSRSRSSKRRRSSRERRGSRERRRRSQSHSRSRRHRTRSRSRDRRHRSRSRSRHRSRSRSRHRSRSRSRHRSHRRRSTSRSRRSRSGSRSRRRSRRSRSRDRRSRSRSKRSRSRSKRSTSRSRRNRSRSGSRSKRSKRSQSKTSAEKSEPSNDKKSETPTNNEAGVIQNGNGAAEGTGDALSEGETAAT
ncbi:putative RNA-binding protein Luc7-like 1 [Lamellibrachia satsuma]|nr:putative RNA-binding protein Luc7-like 1 [Lamellibrachia satsuma]